MSGPIDILSSYDGGKVSYRFTPLCREFLVLVAARLSSSAPLLLGRNRNKFFEVFAVARSAKAIDHFKVTRTHIHTEV